MEVIITLAISGMMCFAIAAFLFAGYHTFETVLDQKRKVEQLRGFRVRLTAQLRSLTDDDFLFPKGEAVEAKKVKFTNWYDKAKPSIISDWTDLVYRKIIFYTQSFDDAGNTVFRRCEYAFSPYTRQITYKEWEAEINPATGRPFPLVAPSSNPGAQIAQDPPPSELGPIVQQVIMTDVNDVQITNSAYGLVGFEDYRPGTLASDLTDPAKRAAKRVNNSRIRIYLDIANPMVMYKSVINIANRAVTTDSIIPTLSTVRGVDDENVDNY